MSDFLVNLAKRSAGLAPVVRTRATPGVFGVEAESASPDAAEARAPSAMIVPTPQTVVATVAPPAGPVGAPQRAPRTTPSIASAPAPPGVVRRVTAASPTSIAAAPPVTSIAAREPHATQRIEATATERLAPIVAPAAIRSLEPANSDERVPPSHVVREERSVIEHRIESVTTEDAPVPMAAVIEPAMQPVVALPVTQPERAIERTVHVRIGAIEIHGAAAQPPAPAAALPAAEPARSAPLTGGFDDYAALRSYAPWTW
ncbi:MAG TPA: hypothetical protein VF461_14825 [Gemmatimonadaceae bacterium]